MARGLLFSMIMLVCTTVGCIVPIPLDQQGKQTNHSPIIAKGEVMPPLGPLPHTAGDLFEFSVPVDDEDLDDNLYARLFIPAGAAPSRTTFESFGGPLPSAGDADHPARRIATFMERDYCRILGSSEIWVVVADLDFTTPDGDKTGGLSDEALWVLTCN